MLTCLENPRLKMIPFIQHGFFTREGGVSTGRYASLNCAYESQDDRQNVRENRSRAMSYFGYPLEALVTVKNCHSDKVMVVDRPWTEDNLPEADAMVTNRKAIMLGSDSADCPIILFAEEEAKIIALAHAGWRGAKKGIIEATVGKMIELGGNLHNIVAAISPCIAQTSYEVSHEFYHQFLHESLDNELYFKKASKINHFMFDLLGYVKSRLLRLQLKAVSDTGHDTYADENRFFSCRRALHQGLPDFGGHLSCISLR